MFRAGLAAGLLLSLLLAGPTASELLAGEFTSIQPLFRGVPLTPRRPEDISVQVKLRNDRPLYAQFRYGSEDSTLVTVVVDRASGASFDLYVDVDRDRIVELEERVPEAGPTRRVNLDAEFVQGEELRRVRRTVAFRLGRTGRTLSLATADLVRHRTQLAGRTVAVVRVDGDANGFFSDCRDRLWVDLNRDGRWDPLSEQFPYGPLVVLNGQ
ncbi:MAG TPA: hypothetical protein EYP14_16285, partial [Planctomycetaceae bacterium]|nr:hypothetical protein [Planctomycetaceae bacterium]